MRFLIEKYFYYYVPFDTNLLPNCIFPLSGGWSTAFGGLTEKAGTAFGAAKTKMANSFSHQNLSEEAVKVN